MENKYELFLSNAVVINVRSENEFKQFIQLMKNLGLSKVDSLKTKNKIYFIKIGKKGRLPLTPS